MTDRDNCNKKEEKPYLHQYSNNRIENPHPNTFNTGIFIQFITYS